MYPPSSLLISFVTNTNENRYNRSLTQRPSVCISMKAPCEKMLSLTNDCKKNFQIDQMEGQNMHLSTYNMSYATDLQKELLDRIALTKLLSFDVAKQPKLMRSA